MAKGRCSEVSIGQRSGGQQHPGDKEKRKQMMTTRGRTQHRMVQKSLSFSV